MPRKKYAIPHMLLNLSIMFISATTKTVNKNNVLKKPVTICNYELCSRRVPYSYMYMHESLHQGEKSWEV